MVQGTFCVVIFGFVGGLSSKVSEQVIQTKTLFAVLKKPPAYFRFRRFLGRSRNCGYETFLNIRTNVVVGEKRDNSLERPRRGNDFNIEDSGFCSGC